MWFIYPYPSRFRHCHWPNRMITLDLVKYPWRIWVKLTDTKPQHSKTKCKQSAPLSGKTIPGFRSRHRLLHSPNLVANGCHWGCAWRLWKSLPHPGRYVHFYRFPLCANTLTYITIYFNLFASDVLASDKHNSNNHQVDLTMTYNTYVISHTIFASLCSYQTTAVLKKSVHVLVDWSFSCKYWLFSFMNHLTTKSWTHAHIYTCTPTFNL